MKARLSSHLWMCTPSQPSSGILLALANTAQLLGRCQAGMKRKDSLLKTLPTQFSAALTKHPKPTWGEEGLLASLHGHSQSSMQGSQVRNSRQESGKQEMSLEERNSLTFSWFAQLALLCASGQPAQVGLRAQQACNKVATTTALTANKEDSVVCLAYINVRFSIVFSDAGLHSVAQAGLGLSFPFLASGMLASQVSYHCIQLSSRFSPK